jgi:soluble lytic murein transglycosylase-like protein
MMQSLSKLVFWAAAVTAVIAAPARPVRIPAASANYRAHIIREAHARGGLQSPVAMFAGQLTQESQFNPNARSHVGAQGLAQFMPATAQWLTKAAPKDFPTANSLDPEWSIRALVWYDYWLYKRVPMYSEVDENRWAAALSGYNGGLGYTMKDAKLGKCSTWWGCGEFVNDGRSASNLAENRAYPQRIIRVWEPAYKKAGWQ